MYRNKLVIIKKYRGDYTKDCAVFRWKIGMITYFIKFKLNMGQSLPAIEQEVASLARNDGATTPIRIILTNKYKT
jgi:hypothetical protein